MDRSKPGIDDSDFTSPDDLTPERREHILELGWDPDVDVPPFDLVRDGFEKDGTAYGALSVRAVRVRGSGITPVAPAKVHWVTDRMGEWWLRVYGDAPYMVRYTDITEVMFESNSIMSDVEHAPIAYDG